MGHVDRSSRKVCRFQTVGFNMSNYLCYLPDQRLQFSGGGGQTDAEGDGVRQAGDGAGDNGPSHGEGQHGVDNEHDEQEEGHLETRRGERLDSVESSLTCFSDIFFPSFVAFPSFFPLER